MAMGTTLCLVLHISRIPGVLRLDNHPIQAIRASTLQLGTPPRFTKHICSSPEHTHSFQDRWRS